ncbi:MAG: ABC transporter ATP-binding protein [Clostridiales bacterium]|nr:ABC transporter ATP-binding protein [Clostridiales bacterium]
MSVIDIRGLTKSYGPGKGIFDLTLQIPRGEVFGYLGPNGSGKTTTIRHLLGFLNADSGSCSIGGLDCRTQAAQLHHSLGYLPGEIAFFDEMRGSEYLRFLAHMRGLRTCPRERELLDRFQLDPSGRIRRMSKGMKQKLGLVAAFMHDPEILVLDEPTSGLDPLMQQAFVELILAEKARGKTILMSSHSFEEIEKTCSRVGILHAGHLSALVDVADLQASRRRVYAVSFDREEDKQAFLAEELDIAGDYSLRVDVAVTGSLQAFTRALSRHPIAGLDVVNQRLEDIFIGYYGGHAS